jgi:hypothetical protein
LFKAGTSQDMFGSLTSNGKIPFGGYKKRSMRPSLRWPLHWLEYTLNQNFSNSNPLSFKLHSNPSFLGEIWAILWVTLSIFKQITSPKISVCLLLLGTCPLYGLDVLWEPPRFWWASKSLYCPLLRRDLIVENWTSLGDLSVRFGVERDTILCRHLNGDVRNLRG